jgi:outer membrane lipoprotein-sorting protein
MYRSTSVEVLQNQISERDSAIHTLNASVLITASQGGGTTGKVTTYVSLKGFIFVRKPGDLRVILQVPLLGSRGLDMVSDGKEFKMLLNSPVTGRRAITGTNEVTTPSKNGLENLRPSVFFDSLLVPGVGADEFVALTEAQRILPPEGKHKVAIEEPDYDLGVLKVQSGHLLHLSRLIHISRIDLLPVEQDVYDDKGRAVTVATYSAYKEFNGQQFPTVIEIKRPLDEYSLKIEITKLTLNGELENDQFALEIPAGTPVQTMK